MTLVLQGMVSSAFALSQPSVKTPSDWYLKSESPYPSVKGIHDPQGSGRLVYDSQDTNAFVDIYYESALNRVYSNSSLVDEAVTLLKEYENFTANYSGMMTAAGVPAGYASIFISHDNSSLVQLVFVKGNYYFDVVLVYVVGSGHDVEAWSIVNSISVPSPEASAGSAALAEARIVGGIGGEVAIVIALAVLMFKTVRTEF